MAVGDGALTVAASKLPGLAGLVLMAPSNKLVGSNRSDRRLYLPPDLDLSVKAPVSCELL